MPVIQLPLGLRVPFSRNSLVLLQHRLLAAARYLQSLGAESTSSLLPSGLNQSTCHQKWLTPSTRALKQDLRSPKNLLTQSPAAPGMASCVSIVCLQRLEVDGLAPDYGYTCRKLHSPHSHLPDIAPASGSGVWCGNSSAVRDEVTGSFRAVEPGAAPVDWASTGLPGQVPSMSARGAGYSRTWRLKCPQAYALTCLGGTRCFAEAAQGGARSQTGFHEVPKLELQEYPPELIRNFSIIAHIDHGKSTLADRLLELTGTIRKGLGQPQYLDKLQVERERGITVKAQTVTMLYDYSPTPGKSPPGGPPAGRYLLNLIDTPGHVDFSYEVSRSLAATQGVLLLVDAAQGIQAQTVANFFLAFEKGLVIVPVINKIDQPSADPPAVALQMKQAFDLDPEDALLTSAKTGQGLEDVLPAVIERISQPAGNPEGPLRILLLDSHYDDYRGVICQVAVVDGALKKGDRISAAATGQSYEVLDVGVMHPELYPTGELLTGQVGYLVAGMRSTAEARVGDTLHHVKQPVEPLPGFRQAQHMVYAGVYPADGSDYEALSNAIERLTCSDPSVSVHKESSGALGAGFRCGFLGLLHMDVFHQRLEQEQGAQVLSTTPTVPYVFEYSDGSKLVVNNPAQVPSNPKHRQVAAWEPTVMATIITPSQYVGSLMTLCSERRGEQTEYSFIDGSRALLKYRLPLREVVTDFYNELKSLTSGYASFDYEDAGLQAADLVKVDVMLNGQPVDALATIAHRVNSQRIARDLVQRLRTTIDRQMFEVAIQASIGSKVIARETLSAMRKNVLAKCYGGDVSRKRKLLEKQKEGKKRMRRIGSVDVPQEAFHQLLKVS